MVDFPLNQVSLPEGDDGNWVNYSVVRGVLIDNLWVDSKYINIPITRG